MASHTSALNQCVLYHHLNFNTYYHLNVNIIMTLGHYDAIEITISIASGCQHHFHDFESHSGHQHYHDIKECQHYYVVNITMCDRM